MLKKIILQGSDSTQAVESFFRALKLYQSQEFGKRLPTLTDLIPSIAKAIDQQFGNRQRLVENKRTVYQHADSNINSALEAASWDLNPTGIKLFYDKILMYEKRREHISIEEDGKIKETYNSGAKVYETDEYSCSCSIFAQYFFCRHMVFFRIETNLPIFDIRAFHTSLHKTNSDLEVHRNNLKSQDMSPSSPGVDMVRKVAQKSRKPRTQANKYNTGFDVAKEMAEVICVYEEETFKTYLECSQNFVRLLRRGLPNNVSDFLQDPDKYDVVRKSDRHELLDHNIDVMKNCSNDFQNKSLEDPDIQTNHTGLKHPTQEMEGNQPGKRPLPIGFREIPGRHQGQFSQECIVKTIKATGGCGYGAVAYKLYNDEDLVMEFRKSCHQFLLRVWDTMNWASFVTYPFCVTIIVGQGESVDFMIKSEKQYLDFLQTEQSLTSFSETNIEVQNICNMLNITIHVFTYNSRANSWYTYEPMQDITRFSEYAYPTNDGLNTVVLYHEEDAHFELIVPRYKALSSAIGQPPVTADVRSENYTVESFNTSALASFLVDNGNYEKFRNPSITSEDKCVNQSMSTDFPPPPVIQTSHSGVFRTSTLLSQSSPFDKAEMSDELPNISIDLTQNTEQTEDFGGLKLQTVINKRGRPKRKREGRNALPKAKRKKFSNFLDDLDSVFEENETFSSGSDKTKIKRKRGRPFKTISDTLHSSSGSSLSMKRKRGRPLKGLNSSRVSSEPSVKVKRKRGRPFKGLSSSGLSSHPSVKDTSDVFKQPYDYETGNLHYSSQSSSVSSYQRSSTGPFRAPNTMKALNRDYPTKAMDDSLEEID